VGTARVVGGAEDKRLPPAGKPQGFRAFNAFLMAVVAVMIGLTCLEIYAYVHPRVGGIAVPETGGEEPAPPPPVVSASLAPSLARLLEALEQRPLFRADSSGSGGQAAAGPSGLSRMRGILSLIGISSGGSEAVLNEIDKKESKLHVVRRGEKVVIGEVELTLEQFTKEEAVLTDGTEKFSVKAQGFSGGS
jgi:hypothetical protein